MVLTSVWFRPAAEDIEEAIDTSLELQLISIRPQKSLNGIGYQPLMRQILKRFVDGEKKGIATERVTDRQAAASEPPLPHTTLRPA